MAKHPTTKAQLGKATLSEKLKNPNHQLPAFQINAILFDLQFLQIQDW